MANPLEVVSKSQYIEAKAREIFRTLLGEYRQGKIQSKTELAYRVYRALQEFYAQIGRPALQVREADGAPGSADYNAMMSELSADLSTLFAEAQVMSGAINQSFDYVETERRALTDRLQQLEDRMKSLGEAVDGGPEQAAFRDSFIDRSRFDVDMVSGTAAEVSQQARALVLGLLEGEPVGEGLSIAILPESNGLPGNTHQVKPGDGYYRFQGEDHMHLDLHAILDGNSDTWFEFESLTVSDQVLAETGGLGFQYKEGLSWLKSSEAPLRLALQVELERPRPLNWITLSPFLPSEKGAGAPRVSKLLIEDGKGNRVDVADDSLLGEERVFLCPKMNVRRVTLVLEQEIGYEILAGHFFFRELEHVNTSIFEQGKVQQGKRVEGPRPALADLDIQYDPVSRKQTWPAVAAGTPVPDRTAAMDRLFRLPEVPDGVQAGLEAVPARRYAIGLRDLELAGYRFASASEYISCPFTSSGGITAITLDAWDDVPVQFGEGDWIDYAISVDDGRNWLPISPRGALRAGAISEYKIGTNTPADQRQAGVGYLDPVGEIRQVRVKITLRRPETYDMPGSDYFTPIVYEYRLNVGTKGGVTA